MSKSDLNISIDKKPYVFLFLLLSTILFIALVYAMNRDIQYFRVQRELTENFAVRTGSKELEEAFTTTISDLFVMTDSIEDIFSSDISEQEKMAAAEKFLTNFSRFNSQYAQFRLINAGGTEKINISNGVLLESQDNINYKTVDYFQKTMGLPSDYMYVSNFDKLNSDSGSDNIENTTLQFCAPIYNNNLLLGIVVVNIGIENVFEDLTSIAEEFDTNLDLIGNNGNIINSTIYKDSGRTDTILDVSQSFSDKYPKEWSLFLRSPILAIRQDYTDEGLFTYTKLDLVALISRNIEHSTRVVFEVPTIYLTSYTLRDSGYSKIFADSHIDDLIYTFETNYFYIALIILVSALSSTLLYFRGVKVKRIKFHSDFDALTETYNRRAGMQIVRNILNSGNTSYLPLSICFLDVNGLKEVNDTLGHQFGDELIVTASSLIKKKIRSNDILMRVGGDEFILVLMNCTSNQAEVIWSKIEESFNNINETEDRPYNISLSHGISEYFYKDASQLEDVLTETDLIMYENKKKIKETFKSIK